MNFLHSRQILQQTFIYLGSNYCVIPIFQHDKPSFLSKGSESDQVLISWINEICAFNVRLSKDLKNENG